MFASLRGLPIAADQITEMQKLFLRTVAPWILLGLGFTLGACGVMEESPPAAVGESNLLLAEEPDPGDVQGIALDDEGNVITGDLDIEDDYAAAEEGLMPADAVTQGSTIYFGYDSTVVVPRFMPVIQRAAARLQTNPSIRLRLEGHTDERGTRNYNLALGERRAQSVRDIILEQGVLAEQVDWVSYGEESPAVTGQGEEAWTKNRRVELILEE